LKSSVVEYSKRRTRVTTAAQVHGRIVGAFVSRWQSEYHIEAANPRQEENHHVETAPCNLLK
jgi:hypothetical protein